MLLKLSIAPLFFERFERDFNGFSISRMEYWELSSGHCDLVMVTAHILRGIFRYPDDKIWWNAGAHHVKEVKQKI